MTDCTVVEILEATHIKPYLGPHTNCVDNGLGRAGCRLAGRNIRPGSGPVKIAVKQMAIQLQSLTNSLKKLHL
ncbi:hypothetical protein D3C72_2055880 [compost metagenome]